MVPRQVQLRTVREKSLRYAETHLKSLYENMALPDRRPLMTRLPRTIRLDASVASVFDRAAEPGEWAVAGGFLFMDHANGVLSPAEHNAFACGFLGTGSFGWSTLVAVAPATDAQVAAVVAALAAWFVSDLGAPSLAEARAAAEQEVGFAAGLCDHPVGTLLTVTRRFEDGGVVERYATITPGDEMARAHAAPIDLLTLADG
jgi:hypothetical protein